MRSANGCCSIRRSSMIHLVGSCKTASALAWSKSLRILSDGGELQKFRNGTRATKTRLLFNRPQSDKNRIRQEQRSRWFGDEASTTRTVLKSLAGLVSSQSWCVGPCGKHDLRSCRFAQVILSRWHCEPFLRTEPSPAYRFRSRLRFNTHHAMHSKHPAKA